MHVSESMPPLTERKRRMLFEFVQATLPLDEAQKAEMAKLFGE